MSNTTSYHCVFPRVPSHPYMGENWDNEGFLKNIKSRMLKKKFYITHETEVGDHFLKHKYSGIQNFTAAIS